MVRRESGGVSLHRPPGSAPPSRQPSRTPGGPRPVGAGNAGMRTHGPCSVACLSSQRFAGQGLPAGLGHFEMLPPGNALSYQKGARPVHSRRRGFLRLDILCTWWHNAFPPRRLPIWPRRGRFPGTGPGPKGLQGLPKDIYCQSLSAGPAGFEPVRALLSTGPRSSAVEHFLGKEGVTSSILVKGSSRTPQFTSFFIFQTKNYPLANARGKILIIFLPGFTRQKNSPASRLNPNPDPPALSTQSLQPSDTGALPWPKRNLNGRSRM